ncbi:oligosaccharide flippase family protein [Frederiksenia canicola]|uniref:PST family polysaccharide transporter n=1 Tax=Frederiksenia canicola TaxID=123824 RepID=A0AAE7C1I8_9PAST|nr:oligosaccharide flippase family protein [Frederiksenia canicola]QIM64079.1 RfbX protein [Frederiksenia canicola]RPE93609.1 PST family polysaccharide transporter [Frederiksenia canicola]
MKKDNKRLLNNFFSLVVLQFFNYVLPFLTLPYLVKTLSVDIYGLVVFAQSLILFVNIFIDWGFNLSATRDISIHRNDKVKLTEIYSSVLAIKVFITLICFLILCVVVSSIPKLGSNRDVYILSFLWAVGQAIYPIWYFQGIEKMKYITLINVSSKIIFTILIFVFVKSDDDYLLVPIFNGLGSIIAAIISLWIIGKLIKQSIKIPSFNVIWMYFQESSSFFLSRLSLSLYTSANTFILGIATSTTIVAYYSIAEQLYKALQAFYSPLSQVLYPYIAKERNIVLFKKIFIFSAILNLLGIIVLYLTSDFIFELFFSQRIGVESVNVFTIFLIASFFVVPSILLGYPFLGAIGYAKYANLSVIYGSVLHIIGLLMLYFADYITLYSVAYMVLLTEIFVLVYRVFIVWRKNLWVKQS